VTVGIDKGGKDGSSFLKVTLSVIPISNNGDEKLGQNYRGVNKAFLIGCVPDIPENNNNIDTIFNKIKVWGLKNYFVGDYKMKNIVCGCQGHTCTYPCANCTSPKTDFDKKGDLRTVASLASDYKRYVEDGAKKSDARNYHNVTSRPLLFETVEETMESDLLVVDMFPPEELHIVLGITNDFFKNMSEISNGAWKDEVDNWAKVALSRREGYHGGQFEGNQCKKLLDNIGFFEDSYGNPRIPQLAPFIVALKAFNEVRQKCFSSSGVSPDYKEVIQKFRQSFLVLKNDYGINITSKTHDVFFHIEDFIERHPGISLGIVSAQSSESVHSKFSAFTQYRLMKCQDHKNFPKQFLDTVVAYNGKRI